MKRSEIALLIIIVAVSLGLSYFIANAVVGEPGQNGAVVEVVEPIYADVADPNPRIFNSKAINPTVRVEIGESSDESPFTGIE